MRVVTFIAVIETVDGFLLQMVDLIFGLVLNVAQFALTEVALEGLPHVNGTRFDHVEITGVTGQFLRHVGSIKPSLGAAMKK